MARSGFERAGAARAAAPGFAPARAGPWTGLAPPDLGLWLAACLRQEVEQRRLFPWLAVAYGLGIGLAFAADGPLALGPPASAASACAIGAILLRRRLGPLVLMLAATALFAGFAATVVRMDVVAAPVLQSLALTKMAGFVETVEERRAGGALFCASSGPRGSPMPLARTACGSPRAISPESCRAITSSARCACCRRPRRPVRAATTSRATPTFAASARWGQSRAS